MVTKKECLIVVLISFSSCSFIAGDNGSTYVDANAEMRNHLRQLEQRRVIRLPALGPKRTAAQPVPAKSEPKPALVLPPVKPCNRYEPLQARLSEPLEVEALPAIHSRLQEVEGSITTLRGQQDKILSNQERILKMIDALKKGFDSSQAKKKGTQKT